MLSTVASILVVVVDFRFSAKVEFWFLVLSTSGVCSGDSVVEAAAFCFDSLHIKSVILQKILYYI